METPVPVATVLERCSELSRAVVTLARRVAGDDGEREFTGLHLLVGLSELQPVLVDTVLDHPGPWFRWLRESGVRGDRVRRWSDGLGERSPVRTLERGWRDATPEPEPMMRSLLRVAWRTASDDAARHGVPATAFEVGARHLLAGTLAVRGDATTALEAYGVDTAAALDRVLDLTGPAPVHRPLVADLTGATATRPPAFPGEHAEAPGPLATDAARRLGEAWAAAPHHAATALRLETVLARLGRFAEAAEVLRRLGEEGFVGHADVIAYRLAFVLAAGAVVGDLDPGPAIAEAAPVVAALREAADPDVRAAAGRVAGLLALAEGRLLDAVLLLTPSDGEDAAEWLLWSLAVACHRAGDDAAARTVASAALTVAAAGDAVPGGVVHRPPHALRRWATAPLDPGARRQGTA